MVRMLSAAPRVPGAMVVHNRFPYVDEPAGRFRDRPDLRKGWVRAERMCFDRADLILCASQEMIALLATLGCRARAIPNAVRPFEFSVDAALSTTRRAAHRVLFMGRLAREKNVDLLLEAYLRLRRHEPRATLRICGAGPRRAI